MRHPRRPPHAFKSYGRYRTKRNFAQNWNPRVPVTCSNTNTQRAILHCVAPAHAKSPINFSVFSRPAQAFGLTSAPARGIQYPTCGPQAPPQSPQPAAGSSGPPTRRGAGGWEVGGWLAPLRNAAALREIDGGRDRKPWGDAGSPGCLFRCGELETDRTRD